jgi:carbonic anhydrase/acetyltransferase-like protein (isoleucine patch superfamily)
MIKAFGGVTPRISETAFVADSADVIGDVVLGEESSVWFHSVIRGDLNQIRIGNRTNIQDLCLLHVLKNGGPVIMGDDVTVGHRAIIHACTIKNRVLVGMGAVILDGVSVGEDSVIGAGALLTPGTVIPPASLVLGSPARVRRPTTQEELDLIRRSARNYVEYARMYKAG